MNYKISNRQSAHHANANALSRFPIDTSTVENKIKESQAVEMHWIETLPLIVDQIGEETLVDKAVQMLLNAFWSIENQILRKDLLLVAWS